MERALGETPHDEFETQFNDHLAHDRLHLAHCGRCDAVLDFDQRLCPQGCDADIVWKEANGAAELYSFVVFRRLYLEAFPAPYVVALVRLAEGPRLICTVQLPPERDLEVGMSLRASFDKRRGLIFKPDD